MGLLVMWQLVLTKARRRESLRERCKWKRQCLLYITYLGSDVPSFLLYPDETCIPTLVYNMGEAVGKFFQGKKKIGSRIQSLLE